MSREATLIFDLDGTLIDSQPGVMESFQEAVEAVLPEVGYDPASVVIGPPLPKMFAVACPSATAAQVKSLVSAFRADYGASGWKKTRVFDGVPETLEALKICGHRMYVVTNKPLDLSMKILRHFRLDAYFERITSLDSVTPAYANKTAMVRSLVLERHLKPEQCVLIGDTVGDAEAARAVNIRFIWVSFGYGKRTEIPGLDKSVDSFAELVSIVG